MRWDRERVLANVRAATTEDLLDRATVYREGMEPEAMDLILRELHDERGISWDVITEYERKRREGVLLDEQGIAVKCHRCRRPAVGEGWGWHRLWGTMPLFPRWFAWCAEHAPKT